jgi:hypothetical protein
VFAPERGRILAAQQGFFLQIAEQKE